MAVLDRPVFVIGTEVADPAFTDIIIEEAELAAQRNPGVASFEGLALNVRDATPATCQ